MNYAASLLVQVCIFAIEVASLDLLVGYTGILSFAHAAFVGIGAYTAALLLVELHLPMPVAFVGSIAVSAAVAYVVGKPTLRLSGDYFFLGTLALSLVSSSIMENWIGLTHGPFGIYGIPALSIAGFRLATPLQFLGVAAAAAAIVLLLKQRLLSGPLGIALRALREDELVSATQGKDVTRLKVMAFTLAGAGAGLAGFLLACNLRFIDPTLFGLPLTIFIWAALFVGGCASWIGNVIGPLLLLCVPEALRFVGLDGTTVAHVRDIFFGALLIGITIFRPQGIAGTYRVR